MRVVKIKIFWGPGVWREVWNLKKLFYCIDRWRPALIPPEPIINQLFAKGTHQDETGVYYWESFTISSAEYEELTLELLTHPHSAYRQIEVPESVKTIERWDNWKKSL